MALGTRWIQFSKITAETKLLKLQKLKRNLKFQFLITTLNINTREYGTKLFFQLLFRVSHVTCCSCVVVAVLRGRIRWWSDRRERRWRETHTRHGLLRASQSSRRSESPTKKTLGGSEEGRDCLQMPSSSSSSSSSSFIITFSQPWALLCSPFKLQFLECRKYYVLKTRAFL